MKLAEIGGAVTEVDRVLHALMKSMDSDEAIIHYVRATMVQSPQPRDERGVLAVTTKRVLFKEHAWYGVVTSLQWPWDLLKGISSRKAMTFEHLSIKSPGGTEKFLIDYGQGDLFIAKVKEAMKSEA